MPNWCSNIVVFTCSKAKTSKLKKFFTDLAKKEEKEEKGQLPDFAQNIDGFFFNIRWEDGVLYYETRWVPNIEVLVAVAEHFIVDFTIEYHEPMMQIYGECSFIKGVQTDVSLEDAEYDLFQVNPEDEDTYLFEGKVYDTDTEILEILLERKKKN